MLQEHLLEDHLPELERLCALMPRKDSQGAAIYSIYNQAVAVKCRSQAPLAGPSLDRTALNSLSEATKGNKVEALMCFSCGGIHPFVEEVADKGNIQWYQPLERCGNSGEMTFLGQPLKVVEGLLGLQVYLSRYNLVEPQQTRLTDNETFDDWTMKLPEMEDGVLLCCPEAGVEVEAHTLYIYTLAEKLPIRFKAQAAHFIHTCHFPSCLRVGPLLWQAAS